MTKQITAALIMQSVERGERDLSQRLSVYLPETQANWSEKVTLHHLLSHSSGIISLEKPLQFEPGSQFMYSNLGYELLGRVLEKIRGNFNNSCFA